MAKLTPVSIVIFLKEPTQNGVSLWVQPRAAKGSLHGLLEFPGGKIESGEAPLDAAVREVHEEVDFQIPETDKLKHFKIHSYTYEDKNISLYVYLYNIKNPPSVFEQKGKWLDLDFDQKSGPLEGQIPPVNHQIIDELLGYLEKESYGFD